MECLRLGLLASTLLWKAVDCHEEEIGMLDDSLHSTPHPLFALVHAHDLFHSACLQQKRMRPHLDEMLESFYLTPLLLQWPALAVLGLDRLSLIPLVFGGIARPMLIASRSLLMCR